MVFKVLCRTVFEKYLLANLRNLEASQSEGSFRFYWALFTHIFISTAPKKCVFTFQPIPTPLHPQQPGCRKRVRFALSTEGKSGKKITLLFFFAFSLGLLALLHNLSPPHPITTRGVSVFFFFKKLVSLLKNSTTLCS